MRDLNELKKKATAAMELVSGSSTTIEKLKSARTMLAGLNPQVDKLLKDYDRHLSALEHVEKGAFVMLAAENLPETTEEEKKRKRALVIFLKTLNQLKGEVARVSKEMESGKDSGSQASMWGKIFSSAAGPLGIITIVAVALGTLNAIAVEVVIENDGCSTLQTKGSMPISIPGFSLPAEPIPKGGSGIATLPPLTFEIDGTASGTLVFASLGLNLSIALSGVTSVVFDDVSLLGAQSTIALSGENEHRLVISCR